MMIKGTMIFDADMCGIWVVVKGWLSLRQSLGGFWLVTILHEKGNELFCSFDIKHIVALKRFDYSNFQLPQVLAAL